MLSKVGFLMLWAMEEGLDFGKTIDVGILVVGS